MRSNTIPIGEYLFSEGDNFLIDTNIWIYLYGPQLPKDWKTTTYSGALAKILAAKSKIWVDVLILSEFINRYCRHEYELQKTKGQIGDFKSFRKSTSFRPVATAIVDAVRRILKQSLRIGTGFETLDLDPFLLEFEKECPDFNDQVLVELCKKENIKIITHDSDFKNSGITVLTANKYLLS